MSNPREIKFTSSFVNDGQPNVNKLEPLNTDELDKILLDSKKVVIRIWKSNESSIQIAISTDDAEVILALKALTEKTFEFSLKQADFCTKNFSTLPSHTFSFYTLDLNNMDLKADMNKLSSMSQKSPSEEFLVNVSCEILNRGYIGKLLVDNLAGQKKFFSSNLMKVKVGQDLFTEPPRAKLIANNLENLIEVLSAAKKQELIKKPITASMSLPDETIHAEQIAQKKSNPCKIL